MPPKKKAASNNSEDIKDSESEKEIDEAASEESVEESVGTRKRGARRSAVNASSKSHSSSEEFSDSDDDASDEDWGKGKKKRKKSTPKKGRAPGRPRGSKKSKSSNAVNVPNISKLDFSSNAKSESGDQWNLKISSWNVNGIRAWLEKDGAAYILHEKPDIFCIQETKCSDEKLPEDMKSIPGYNSYWLSGDQEGYSGVGLISKQEPIEVTYGIDMEEHDKEGRVITAEYDKFYLVGTYVPNAGRGLVRLDYRMTWDKEFRAYLKKLDKKKPVILCGDLNVAHHEIDIANPKSNKKNAGFTQEERDGFSALLDEDFLDSFRVLHPEEKGAYTFWTYMMNARAKNVGWRLDYFVLSSRLKPNLCDSLIRKDVYGSDHCPIVLLLHV